MPQNKKRLTAAFVRNAAPGVHLDSAYRYGLQLRVTESGAGRWVQRLAIKGDRVDLGLGSTRLVSLSEARQAAFENQKIARSGGDPRKKARSITFADAVDRFLEDKGGEFGNERHAKNWRSSFDRLAIPIIGDRAISDIETEDVLKVLRPVWETTNDTARRLRGRIEAVMSWAAVAGYRQGANPATWKGNLSELLPKPSAVAKRGNWPALQLDDARDWFADLRGREGTATRALELLALTAARSGEIRGAEWSEIDLKAGLWIIPGERMKAGREHRIPLTEPAMRLLKALPRHHLQPLLFPAQRGGMLSDMSISAAMKRIHEARVKKDGRGYVDRVTGRPAVPHGLRSTFKSWSIEVTDYPNEMSEVSLAHLVGNEVERAYRRSDMLDKRRLMMAQWAAFLGADKPADDLGDLLG